MIKSLYLKNIFLFNEETIHFDEGLNIITGETGSGKSTIIKAISLVLGEKADVKIIQDNSDKAIIEATFDISSNTLAKQILKDGDIEFDEEILIRREIFKNKKNRFFINDQLIPLTLINKLSSSLIEIISQNSTQNFISQSYQLKILDNFANLEDEVRSFSKNFIKLQDLNDLLEDLLEKKSHGEKQKNILEDQLAEIKEVNILENEDDILKQEHSLVANSHDILEKLNSMYYQLLEGNESVIYKVKSFHNTLSALLKYNEGFKDNLDLIKNISLELEEVINNLTRHKSNIEPNPQRLIQIEQRLSQIHKIHKKYGYSFHELEEYKSELTQKLSSLENIDEEIEKTKKDVLFSQNLCNKKAEMLSKKRKINSSIFKRNVSDEIQTLNMPNAQFEIDIRSTKRSKKGDDQLSFLFSANIGQKPSLFKNTISGGELSRIILVIKTILSKKDKHSSIIFDEIDANIGGRTATIIAEKLKNLGSSMQIIAITHFVQVAKHANNHYLAYKQESDTTHTHIKKLNKNDKLLEFDRMIGISS